MGVSEISVEKRLASLYEIGEQNGKSPMHRNFQMAGIESVSVAGFQVGADALAQIIAAAVGGFITLIASALGFLLSSWRSRKIAQKDLKRQKLEEFCVSIQESMSSISRIVARCPLPQDTIALSTEIEPYVLGLSKALGQAHAYKMLYCLNDFEPAYHRVVQASRVIGVIVEGGGSAYSRKRLMDLLGTLNGLITLVWAEFKAVLA